MGGAKEALLQVHHPAEAVMLVMEEELALQGAFLRPALGQGDHHWHTTPLPCTLVSVEEREALEELVEMEACLGGGEVTRAWALDASGLCWSLEAAAGCLFTGLNPKVSSSPILHPWRSGAPCGEGPTMSSSISSISFISSTSSTSSTFSTSALAGACSLGVAFTGESLKPKMLSSSRRSFLPWLAGAGGAGLFLSSPCTFFLSSFCTSFSPISTSFNTSVSLSTSRSTSTCCRFCESSKEAVRFSFSSSSSLPLFLGGREGAVKVWGVERG